MEQTIFGNWKEGTKNQAFDSLGALLQSVDRDFRNFLKLHSISELVLAVQSKILPLSPRRLQQWSPLLMCSDFIWCPLKPCASVS